MTATLPLNMRAKVVVTEAGCWQWVGCLNSRGYGCTTDGTGRVVLAHRRSYELLVGPIPAGLQIDHLCRNKPCVRPDHLEPVTAKVNSNRRPDVHKSHCVHGHEMTAANTIVKFIPSGHEIRNCRECANKSRRDKRAALRAAS